MELLWFAKKHDSSKTNVSSNIELEKNWCTVVVEILNMSRQGLGEMVEDYSAEMCAEKNSSDGGPSGVEG